MTEEDKKLVDNFVQCRKQIRELRVKLNVLDEEKEAVFAQKNEYSNQISALIKEIKQCKRERDGFTSKVKELKVRRKELNDSIKKKIEKLKVIKQERDEKAKKLNIKGNPVKIAKEIEKLEFQIETEALPFSQEKRIMKKINDLRKNFSNAEKLTNFFSKSDDLSKAVKKERSEANKVHSEIQDLARQSQDKHEAMLELSKKVDELKVKENEQFTKFIEMKEKVAEVNNELKKYLVQVNSISDNINSKKVQKTRAKKEKEEKQLKKKGEEVDQKIKLGKKLTTEDLLVFQKTMGDE